MAAAMVGPGKDITDWMVLAQKEGGALTAVLMGIGAATIKMFGGEINRTKVAENNVTETFKTVSYTHLDVYKRQEDAYRLDVGLATKLIDAFNAVNSVDQKKIA